MADLTRSAVTGVLLAGCLVAVPGGSSGAAAASHRPTTWRVSVASNGHQADDESWGPAAIGRGGRIVAFSSRAANLVRHDTNHRSDVFLRDRRTGRTTRVSVGRHGRQADGGSSGPVISADGRYVAFDSSADNLAGRDSNGHADVFVRDRRRGTTERVSVSSSGRQGDRTSHVDAISPDGRYVVFWSAATTLVAEDTNHRSDVFVRDRVAKVTVRASLSSTGGQGDRGSYNADISADGRYVTFTSWSATLVPGDTNADSDVFLRDLAAGTTTLVSATSTGAPGSAASDSGRLSDDGRRVAFLSDARDLVPGDTNRHGDVFVRDLARGETRLVSLGRGGRQADGMSTSVAISGSGRYVAFSTLATNLAAHPTRHVQVFVRDLAAARTRLVSRGADGRVAGGDCFVPSLSPDGKYVGFESRAELMPGDTGGHWDVFLRRWRS